MLEERDALAARQTELPSTAVQASPATYFVELPAPTGVGVGLEIGPCWDDGWEWDCDDDVGCGPLIGVAFEISMLPLK